MRDYNTTQSNNRLHSVLMHAYFVRHEYSKRNELELLSQQGDTKTQSRRQRVLATADEAKPVVERIKNTLYNNANVEPSVLHYSIARQNFLDRLVFDHFTPTHWRMNVEENLFDCIDILTLNALAVKHSVLIRLEWWNNTSRGRLVSVRVTPQPKQVDLIDDRP